MIDIYNSLETRHEIRLTFDEYDTYSVSILNKIKLLPNIASHSEYGDSEGYIITWTEFAENTTDLKTFLGEEND